MLCILTNKRAVHVVHGARVQSCSAAVREDTLPLIQLFLVTCWLDDKLFQAVDLGGVGTITVPLYNTKLGTLDLYISASIALQLYRWNFVYVNKAN